jgi:hypothetical protein
MIKNLKKMFKNIVGTKKNKESDKNFHDENVVKNKPKEEIVIKHETCPNCKMKYKLTNIHRGGKVYINYYKCTMCGREKTISTFWDLGYSTDKDYSYIHKHPIFHKKVYPFPKDKCPICESKLELEPIAYSCGNKCYSYIKQSFITTRISIFGEDFIFKDLSNSITTEEIYFKIQDKISYLKENDRYLTEILISD